MNPDLWTALDILVESSRIVVDRPKGYVHPRFPGYEYPLDYGFLEGTYSQDGEAIDVWVGTHGEGVTGVLVTVDLGNRDSEIKVLIGCDDSEMEITRSAYDHPTAACTLLKRY